MKFKIWRWLIVLKWEKRRPYFKVWKLYKYQRFKNLAPALKDAQTLVSKKEAIYCNHPKKPKEYEPNAGVSMFRSFMLWLPFIKKEEKREVKK